MTSTITLGGQSVTLVTMPGAPGFKTVEWDAEDAGAEHVSPFTGQTQILQWPGADSLSGTMTLPNLTQPQADAWLAFLLSCRGKANAFQLGDPVKQQPAGNIGNSVPVVDNSAPGSNAVGMQVLSTAGWDAGAAGLLLPGDWLQVGYRLHRVVAQVDGDDGGKAQIAVWPSLREVPVDAGALTLGQPAGLFRRADNKFAWSTTVGPVTSLSFRVQEYR